MRSNASTPFSVSARCKGMWMSKMHTSKILKKYLVAGYIFLCDAVARCRVLFNVCYWAAGMVQQPPEDLYRKQPVGGEKVIILERKKYHHFAVHGSSMHGRGDSAPAECAL
jgi:hypothetical protein